MVNKEAMRLKNVKVLNLSDNNKMRSGSFQLKAQSAISALYKKKNGKRRKQ